MPKERFEKLCEIGFPFWLGHHVEDVPSKAPHSKTSATAFATPDVSAATSLPVMPETCPSATAYGPKLQKNTNDDDDKDSETEKEMSGEEDAGTEDDSTVVDGDDDDDESASGDDESTLQSTEQGKQNVKRKSVRSRCVADSVAESEAADALIPDDAVSSGVVFASKHHGQTSHKRRVFR